ncbi:MAG: response regulator transcription factor [Leadbetterella sp.]|nr:response regulator transcription factor [Leadbetterella sp.]
MLRAIIIDDEPACISILKLQIEKYCPQVSIVAEGLGGGEGLSAIRKHQPDLVFLDIEMPVMNGFQLLENLDADINFSIVFTTAYNDFAVKAFKFSALEYLLKPIDIDELQKAVAKAENKKNIEKQQIELLRQSLYAPGRNPDRLALPHATGYIFVEINKIVYCESDSAYTKFYLSTGEKLLITKTLGDVEEVLSLQNFFRIHKQFLVNMSYITQYIKGEGGFVKMTNGAELPIARNRRESFVSLLTRI